MLPYALARSIRVWALLGVVALVACARNEARVERTIAPPPEVRARAGVARFTLDAVLLRDGTPAFAYRGENGVAPTVRIAPGERIEVELHNRMRAQPERSNDVNLHFHGLAVSPRPPGDDSLTTLARPGQTLHYVVSVPPNHPPGLYWYHPHVHGETFWQVAHGMSGAIVIAGIEKRMPALAGMRERIVILRQRPVGNAITEAGNAPANAEAIENGDGNPCRPEIALRPTIDGEATETFAIGRGERQFFRVLNASASRYFDLSIDGVALQLVALDGVPLDAYPGSAAALTVDHVTLAPAGRAEFVVAGPAAPALLRSRCVDSGPAGDAQPATILGSLTPDTDATPSPAVPLVAVAKPAGNVLYAPPPAPALVRTIRLTEDANHFYIDGKTFDMHAAMGPPALVARAGTVEEWRVVNDTDEAHDFHVHQVHFALETIDGKPAGVRHWIDTVTIPSRIHHWNRTEPGRAGLLVDFRNPIVRGRFLLHCHILDHEDRGMMTTIEVR